jgi:hypothetical protein
VKIPAVWVVVGRRIDRSGQAAEHGIEQGPKARALVEAGENSAGLLLENPMTDFVGGTFQERTHTFWGCLHMKL